MCSLTAIPSSDPQTALTTLPVREDPIRLEVDDDLRRSRLTVFFRLLLAIPHIMWLWLWGARRALAWFAAWFATLFAGQSPDGAAPLPQRLYALPDARHRLSDAVANPFPGFAGQSGSYPVELQVAPRERQNRWTVFFRLLLALPAAFLAGAYGGLLGTAAMLGWFAAMVRGQMPLGCAMRWRLRCATSSSSTATSTC